MATIAPDPGPEPTAAQALQARLLARPATETRRMADAIRALAIDAVEQAKSGHPGMPMGMADVATVLFTRFLKYDAADPRWPDRDRFVLSATTTARPPPRAPPPWPNGRKTPGPGSGAGHAAGRSGTGRPRPGPCPPG